jgi:hypothetical protein
MTINKNKENCLILCKLNKLGATQFLTDKLFFTAHLSVIDYA